MDDVVLAMCGGYGAEAVLPFLRSLRASGFTGECVLFLHRNPEGTGEALCAEGASVVEVDLPGVPETWSYNIARYAAFAAHLERHPARRVLLSDSRDVLFQRDPFLACRGDAIHLCEEHPAKSIGDCIWTSSWIRYRYGDPALAPWRDKPVICSGVAFGSARCVRDYISLMVKELTPPLRARNYMAGYDQGVANVLAHGGRIGGLELHRYASAPVLHLGNAPAGSLHRNAAGEVLNDAGEVALAIHQYDRHGMLPRGAGRMP
jgi:hypothetical protein